MRTDSRVTHFIMSVIEFYYYYYYYYYYYIYLAKYLPGLASPRILELKFTVLINIYIHTHTDRQTESSHYFK